MNGFVYLLLEVNQHGEESHKIGISKNDPTLRKKNLQTGNSNKIDVLKTYCSPHYKKIEQWLHGKYSNKKTEADNEWFILSNEEVMSFNETCKKIEDTINFLKKENHFYK